MKCYLSQLDMVGSISAYRVGMVENISNCHSLTWWEIFSPVTIGHGRKYFLSQLDMVGNISYLSQLDMVGNISTYTAG